MMMLYMILCCAVCVCVCVCIGWGLQEESEDSLRDYKYGLPGTTPPKPSTSRSVQWDTVLHMICIGVLLYFLTLPIYWGPIGSTCISSHCLYIGVLLGAHASPHIA